MEDYLIDFQPYNNGECENAHIELSKEQEDLMWYEYYKSQNDVI